jgi:hypothetical protein
MLNEKLADLTLELHEANALIAEFSAQAHPSLPHSVRPHTLVAYEANALIAQFSAKTHLPPLSY